MPDYDIVVCEFELQPRYDVHFQTSKLEKGMNCLIQTSLVGIRTLSKSNFQSKQRSRASSFGGLAQHNLSTN